METQTATKVAFAKGSEKESQLKYLVQRFRVGNKVEQIGKRKNNTGSAIGAVHLYSSQNLKRNGSLHRTAFTKVCHWAQPLRDGPEECDMLEVWNRSD